MCAGDFNQMEVNKFVEESLKMSRFKHRHLMNLIGVCLDAGASPYIIMPYMENRCLLDYLKKERDSLVITESHDDDQVLYRVTLVYCINDEPSIDKGC